MEHLSWTGSLSFLTVPLLLATALTGAAVALHRFDSKRPRWTPGVGRAVPRYGAIAVLAFLAVFGIGCLVFGTWVGILGGVIQQLWPVWAGLVLAGCLWGFARRQSAPVSDNRWSHQRTCGTGLVLFWVCVATFSAVIAPASGNEPLLINAAPGTPYPDGSSYALLGTDGRGRDVLAITVNGAAQVVTLAPLAAICASIIGAALSLIAAVCSDRVGTGLSFILNLPRATPAVVIYILLVSHEAEGDGTAHIFAALLVGLSLMLASLGSIGRWPRWTAPKGLFAAFVILTLWVVLSIISGPDAPIDILPGTLDPFDPTAETSITLVTLILALTPSVFSALRRTAARITARDHVAAARMRGEGIFGILTLEILPNMGAAIVATFWRHVALATVLLIAFGVLRVGALDSVENWGAAIASGSATFQDVPHVLLMPALACLSLLLGLLLVAQTPGQDGHGPEDNLA